MLVSIIVYRLLLLSFRTRRLRLGIQDVGGTEAQVRRWWRFGGGLITLTGLAAMFGYVILSGADLLSPINESIELGLIYAMLGVGLTLTYAVVKVPNFAHGEMATIGAYTMAYSHTVWHFPLPVAFAAAAGAGAILGLLQHLLVYRPLIRRGAKIVQIMIGSFALSLMLRAIFWIFAVLGNIAQYSPVSANPLTRYVIPFIQLNLKIPFTQIAINTPGQILLADCAGFCRLGTSAVTDLFVWLVMVSVPLVLLMHLLLTRTLIGKSMRAIADNIELSQVTGINVEFIREITWLLVGAITGLGGAFLGIEFPIWPELGWTYLLRVFAAVTVGGLVSFYGTIAGGLIVGFGELWVTIVGTNFGLSTTWQPFTVFLIIVLVLLIRPAGLSGLNIRMPSTSLIGDLKRTLRVRHTREGETTDAIKGEEMDGRP